MNARTIRYLLVLSLSFGATHASAAFDVRSAMKAFINACTGREKSKAPQPPTPPPVTEQKMDPPHVLLARALGFEVDTDSVAQIEKEIEDFLTNAPLTEMANEVAGRNGLSGRPQGPGQAVLDILNDTTTTPEQKRALLRQLYMYKLDTSDTDILQIIRYRNSLEQRIGGWGNLWDGYYQYTLNKNSDLESFSRRTSTIRGLLYLPGPDSESFRVFGATNDHADPLALISLANGGRPIEVSDLVVFQEKKVSAGTAWSLKFTAVIRRPNDAGTPEGAKLVSGGPAPITADHFLVPPFGVDKETIALSKNADGTYVFHFRQGYRFAARINSSLTPNGHDLEAVISVALRDAGITADQTTIRRDGEQTRIALGENVNQNTRDQFETELASRVRELVDPRQARASRESRFRAGVDPKIAAAAKQSGYEDDAALIKALGLGKTNGSSTYSDASPWHATYPFLISPNNGEYEISVDDRIYSDGARFDGLDTLTVARNQPMVPVQTPSGAYIVLSRKKPALLWSGYLEYYSVFADLEKAEAFIRTHRFVVEQK